jgi:hypothetical protein
VKVPAGTLFTGRKVFEKTEKLEIPIKSSQILPFDVSYSKNSEFSLNDKTLAYVNGIIEKDSKGSLFIKAKEISNNLNTFFPLLRQRLSMAKGLLFLSAVLFISYAIYKVVKSFSPSLSGGIICMHCKNFSNTIFVPCFHMKMCRTCALHQKNCPSCNQRIRSLIQIIPNSNKD